MVLIGDMPREELRSLAMGVLREYSDMQFENFFAVFGETYHGQGILDRESVSNNKKSSFGAN